MYYNGRAKDVIKKKEKERKKEYKGVYRVSVSQCVCVLVGLIARAAQTKGEKNKKRDEEEEEDLWNGTKARRNEGCPSGGDGMG